MYARKKRGMKAILETYIYLYGDQEINRVR